MGIILESDASIVNRSYSSHIQNVRPVKAWRDLVIATGPTQDERERECVCVCDSRESHRETRQGMGIRRKREKVSRSGEVVLLSVTHPHPIGLQDPLRAC